MDKQQLAELEQEIKYIESQGHGEVVVKIKNGTFWRILVTKDKNYLALDKKEGNGHI